MKFEKLKEIMLTNGWTYEQNVIPKTGDTKWDHVFTKNDKCWYGDADSNIWFPYSCSSHKKHKTDKKLYKHIILQPITVDNIVEVLEYNGLSAKYIDGGFLELFDDDGCKLYSFNIRNNPKWLKSVQAITGKLKKLPIIYKNC